MVKIIKYVLLRLVVVELHDLLLAGTARCIDHTSYQWEQPSQKVLLDTTASKCLQVHRVVNKLPSDPTLLLHAVICQAAACERGTLMKVAC